MELAKISASQTMSSLEIAALTGKEHSDVLKDIRRILEEAEIGLGGFTSSYKNSQNKEQPCFNLPRRECDLVVSGYSVKYRLAIIDRWQELEAMQVQVHKVPQTLSEALMLGAELAKKVEVLALENSQKAELIESQAHRLDEAKKWASVKRMETSYGLTFKFSELKKYSIKHGYAMPKVRDANYAAGVNTYHEDVWMAVYQVDIPE
jgi:Rha family phage regulatory protein